MITTIDGLPEGVDGFRVSGVVGHADVATSVVPALDRAEARGVPLRALVVVDTGFRGIAADALWDQLAVGLRALDGIEGCAVVSDLAAVRLACTAAAFLPYPVRVFGDVAGAAGWLDGLRADGFRVELRESDGVVLATAGRPLRAADVDVLAREVDRWTGEHRADLTGLVISVPQSPAWANPAAALRHAAFVLTHQHRIRRVALAVDGVMPAFVPFWVGPLLHPGVRQFHHSDLAEAITWAESAGEPAPAGL